MSQANGRLPRRRRRKNTPDPKALGRTMALVRPHLKDHKLLVVGGVLALLAEVVFRILEPWPLKFVIDAVSTSLGADLAGAQRPASLQLLALCGLATVVIVGLRALTNFASTVAFALAGSRVATTIRARVFGHVQGLSQDFHSRNRSADTVQRIVSDVGRLQEVAVTAGLPMLANVITFVAMFAVMAWIDPVMSLIVLAAVVVFVLLSRGSSGKITTAARKTRKGEGELANTAQESLSAIKVVQAYNLQGHLAQRFAGSNQKALTEGVKSRRLAAALERRTDFIVGLATAAVIVGGGMRVMQGAMTPGDLVLFTTYLKTTMKPLRDMAKYTGRIARAAASGERVADLMDMRPTVHDRPDARPLEVVEGRIVYDCVSAGYEGVPAVRQLDLQVEPGQTVALIGESGSGKSTLASLLTRAMDPMTGQVRIDGVPLTQVQVESLRDQVAVVLQEAVLFTGTIRDNIALGRPEASEEEIVAAAVAAQADGFIREQPEGYHTQVGERGGTLSGGQRQRIAIARALLRDTPLVVLDEVTTGLDPVSAADVLESIAALSRGRTTVLVTHDAEVALRADRVVWLQEGRIVRDGSPARLMAEDGMFAEWVRAQQAAAHQAATREEATAARQVPMPQIPMPQVPMPQVSEPHLRRPYEPTAQDPTTQGAR